MMIRMMYFLVPDFRRDIWTLSIKNIPNPLQFYIYCISDMQTIVIGKQISDQTAYVMERSGINHT